MQSSDDIYSYNLTSSISSWTSVSEDIRGKFLKRSNQSKNNLILVLESQLIKDFVVKQEDISFVAKPSDRDKMIDKQFKSLLKLKSIDIA